jgi:sugar O-acyltransferase (sialic acid O-acetyltransferase NeuD family)
MKPIYIVGASGLAKEVATYILDCKEFSIATFIDKEEKKSIDATIPIRKKEYHVISENVFFSMCKQQRLRPYVVIAIGHPKIRRLIAEKYSVFCNFPNIIHPNVFCQSMPRLGKGNIIAPHVMLSVDITIGNFNLINYGTTIGHDSTIGDFNVILPQNIISGNVAIGSQNLLGAGTSVIEMATIGNENIIGMGSVCIKSIDNSGTWIGVPAKKYTHYSDVSMDDNIR